MRFISVLIFLIISGSFGFTQNSKYRIVFTRKIWYDGLYHISRQRREEYRHIIYDDSIRTNTTFLHDYEQYENILFFRSSGGSKNIIWDRINNNIILTNIESVDSIVFTDKNTITIKGFHTVDSGPYWNPYASEAVKADYGSRWINKISEEITITYNNLNNNIYHNVDVTDEMIGNEIQKNEHEGNSGLFFSPVEQIDNKYFSFNFYDKYIAFDFSEFALPYDYITIEAIYNKTFDEYYVFVESYKGDH